MVKSKFEVTLRHGKWSPRCQNSQAGGGSIEKGVSKKIDCQECKMVIYKSGSNRIQMESNVVLKLDILDFHSSLRENGGCSGRGCGQSGRNTGGLTSRRRHSNSGMNGNRLGKSAGVFISSRNS